MRVKIVWLTLLFSVLLYGCAKGKFSVQEGSAKFTIPFDLPSQK